MILTTWMFTCDHDDCQVAYVGRATTEVSGEDARQQASIAGWTFTANGDHLCSAHSTPPTIGTKAVCRTCVRPITYEVVEEDGYKPRTGWSDGFSVDALICFKAADYRHVPPSGVCRRCRCTEDRACEGGCSWAGPDLCSRCVS